MILLHIVGNGKMVKDGDMDCNNGKMVQYMKEVGQIMYLMG